MSTFSVAKIGHRWYVGHCRTGKTVGRFRTKRVARQVADHIQEIAGSGVNSDDITQVVASFPCGLVSWIRDIETSGEFSCFS